MTKGRAIHVMVIHFLSKSVNLLKAGKHLHLALCVSERSTPVAANNRQPHNFHVHHRDQSIVTGYTTTLWIHRLKQQQEDGDSGGEPQGGAT